MKETTQTEQQEAAIKSGMSRRRFFGLAGAVAGAGLVLGAESCNKKEDTDIKYTNDDFGVLNYAYLLEQLEAAFYTQLIATPYNGISQLELKRLTEIRDHEIAHREFLKSTLGDKANPTAIFNFYSVDFTSRDSVLRAAQSLEDVGVSASNGAGKLFSDPNYLLLAGKMASVEGRHAAYVRNLLKPYTFADNDVIDPNGMDLARTPSQVLGAVGQYIVSVITLAGLPT